MACASRLGQIEGPALIEAVQERTRNRGQRQREQAEHARC
jgi:hypothetical protein